MSRFIKTRKNDKKIAEYAILSWLENEELNREGRQEREGRIENRVLELRGCIFKTSRFLLRALGVFRGEK